MGSVDTHLVSKSTGVLADGREIIYFDESPGLGRAAIRDTRDLGPAAAGDASELRFDPLLGEWVILAASRQDRTFLPPADACPLCPSRPGRPTEIPAPDYDVVVFENRFPSLRGAGGQPGRAAASAGASQAPGTAGARGAGVADPEERVAGELSAADPERWFSGEMGARRPGYGRCEVVCFTSDHNASFASLSPRRARTVLEAWADRTAELGALPGISQVYCFENRGEEIGVTLHHPHGQVYAFPFVTPRTATMLARARAYRQERRRNLFDDLVSRELAAGTRMVRQNEHWAAFVPEAARWPFEVLLFPAARVPDIPALAGPARAGFGELYLDVLRRLDGLFGIRMPYIAAWHQAPAGDGFAAAEFGLHLQVMAVRRAPGKLKYLAGTESGMGVWSNDVTPEAAAQRLREAG
jgi:UDPglucose--hexose-1-phosphate uridylyltransferase